ncbi:transcriptional regulator [Evansella sp. AB-P1]|uniref:transcriptional regulator n=1 Tax=Evansella sp. AB-P1 TaxID=3037653 RepID=UPI00241DEE25|nr:transcriptional regulator [Evansella sp. AB-P1]MDG5789518.1 transcriptional regulator [Evansella sp. AB-P1]
MELLLKKAVVTGNPMMVMYMSKKGLITKRMVTVERFNSDQVEVFCHLRKAYRRFLRENILAILPVTYEEIGKDRMES